MDRREFVKFVAAIAAGVSARPETLLAFEHYYNINTPFVSTTTGLVMVDEVFISGMSRSPVTLHWKFTQTNEARLNFGVNGYGGVIRWVATPMQNIMTLARDFRWFVTAKDRYGTVLDNPMQYVEGHILYVDQDGARQTHVLTNGCNCFLGA